MWGALESRSETVKCVEPHARVATYMHCCFVASGYTYQMFVRIMARQPWCSRLTGSSAVSPTALLLSLQQLPQLGGFG